MKALDVEGVSNWLVEKVPGIPDSVKEVFSVEEIDGRALLLLTEDDMRNTLKLKMGWIKKIGEALEREKRKKTIAADYEGLLVMTPKGTTVHNRKCSSISHSLHTSGSSLTTVNIGKALQKSYCSHCARGEGSVLTENDMVILPSELNPLEIELVQKVGFGVSGEVWKASLNGADICVKKLKQERPDDYTLRKYREEIGMLANLRHPNVVLYMGACRAPRGNLWIVTEFCAGGSLLQHLRHLLIKPNDAMIRSWLLDIAAAMRFLHSRGVLHRDLAARNVLLSSSGGAAAGGYHHHRPVLKVADFGLSSLLEEGQEYYRGTDGYTSVWWTSPEALTQRKFSRQSDVWSFGVLCWEMCSKGDHPYVGVAAKHYIAMLERGERLALDEHWSSSLLALMRDCWSLDARQRPSFQHIQQRLSAAAEEVMTMGDTDVPGVVRSLYGQFDEEENEYLYADAVGDNNYVDVTSTKK